MPRQGQGKPARPLPATQRVLADDETLWQSRQRVVLHVSAEAAPHFRRRKLLASQKIEQALPDGGLLVSMQAAHAGQVLPLVRAWMPHLRISSPAAWQAELEQGLKRYLDARARTASEATQPPAGTAQLDRDDGPAAHD